MNFRFYRIAYRKKSLTLRCKIFNGAPDAVRRRAFLTIITNDFRHNCLYLQMNCRN